MVSAASTANTSGGLHSLHKSIPIPRAVITEEIGVVAVNAICRLVAGKEIAKPLRLPVAPFAFIHACSEGCRNPGDGVLNDQIVAAMESELVEVPIDTVNIHMGVVNQNQGIRQVTQEVGSKQLLNAVAIALNKPDSRMPSTWERLISIKSTRESMPKARRVSPIHNAPAPNTGSGIILLSRAINRLSYHFSAARQPGLIHRTYEHLPC